MFPLQLYIISITGWFNRTSTIVVLFGVTVPKQYLTNYRDFKIVLSASLPILVLMLTPTNSGPSPTSANAYPYSPYKQHPSGVNPLTLRKEKVMSITAMILFRIILHPAVLIYDSSYIHNFIIILSPV